MNTQQILIEIRVNLQQQALQALTRSLGNLGNAAKTIQAGFGSMASGILGAIRQLTLWDSLFGRVTSAMIVWAGWRAIWRGFGFIADAIVGGNERMQTAIQTFTALSGGSREMANNYIAILQDLSIKTGASFDDLIANAKRLPTQVGQNLEAFTKLSKEAIVLGFLDPLQGIPGAFYAITNALEGDMEGFRSLIRRFEFSNRQDVKRILEETSNPMEALEKIFQSLGIDVDNLIESLKNTLPVIITGLKNAFQIFFRVLGEPVITKITADLGKLRDAMSSNLPVLKGFALAFGEGIVGAYDKIKGFVSEIFLGGGAFDPGQFTQGAINLMASFSEGLFSGFTNYVLPAITSIATFIAGFFIGASPPALGPLAAIREGGEETIRQFVLGMIAGLSVSDIGALAQGIINNIINLEGLELAEEHAIDSIERWVDEAARAVQAARDRLQLFDIQTADIPERYTRGRRRQLELEAMAAEKEERRRREQLKLAQEQLKVTREYLQAQRRILQLLEQQQKAQAAAAKAAEATKKEFDKSFKAGPDIAGQDELIKQWQEKWAKALEPVKKAWKEGFRDIGDFIRGVLGKPPAGMEGFFGQKPPEMWLLGADMRTALKTLADGLKAIEKNVTAIFTAAKDNWDKLPDGLKIAIAGLTAAVVAPKALGILGILIELAKPGDPTGIAMILGAILGGKVFNLLLAPIKVALESAGAALLGNLTLVGATLLAPEIMLPLILMATIFLGSEEISKWLSGERVRQLKVIFEVDPRLFFKGIADLFASNPFLRALLPGATLIPWGELSKEYDKIGTQSGEGLMAGIGAAISNAATDLANAVNDNIIKPTVDFFDSLYDAIVGKSIIPDMLRDIIRLFTQFPFRLQPPLMALTVLMTTTITQIRITWETNLMAMVDATIAAVDAMQATLRRLQQTTTTQVYDPTTGTFIDVPEVKFTNTVTAPAANVLGGGRGAGTTKGTRLTLQLDAAETRRLMEEGVYTGILNVAGAITTRATA